MNRCPRCQFELSSPARRCGWCGFDLAERQVRGQPAPRHGTIIGIPDMPALGPTTLTMPPPAASDANAGLFDASDAGTYSIAMELSLPATDFDATPFLPYPDSGATPFRVPAPPPPQVSRWWLWPVGVLALLSWISLQTTADWADVATTMGHLTLIAAAGIGCGVVMQHNVQHLWRHCAAPLRVAGVLGLSGITLLVLAPRLNDWQAQQALQQHNYALAVSLDTAGGQMDAAAQVQLDWAKDLTQSGDFASAQSHADRALTASGHTLAVARETEGLILWQWGQSAYQAHDLNAARSHWQAAASRFGATAAGTQAATALAAPQTVTGRLVWLGAIAVPSLQVALVAGPLQPGSDPTVRATGERLEALTDTSGAFAIPGVRPGVTYTLLWVGGLGDFTLLDAHGNPRYHIQVLPLAGSDLGTIAIDKP